MSTEKKGTVSRTERDSILFPGARHTEARMVCHKVSPNTLLAACPQLYPWVSLLDAGTVAIKRAVLIRVWMRLSVTMVIVERGKEEEAGRERQTSKGQKQQPGERWTWAWAWACAYWNCRCMGVFRIGWVWASAARRVLYLSRVAAHSPLPSFFFPLLSSSPRYLSPFFFPSLALPLLLSLLSLFIIIHYSPFAHSHSHLPLCLTFTHSLIHSFTYSLFSTPPLDLPDQFLDTTILQRLQQLTHSHTHSRTHSLTHPLYTDHARMYHSMVQGNEEMDEPRWNGKYTFFSFSRNKSNFFLLRKRVKKSGKKNRC